MRGLFSSGASIALLIRSSLGQDLSKWMDYPEHSKWEGAVVDSDPVELIAPEKVTTYNIPESACTHSVSPGVCSAQAKPFAVHNEGRIKVNLFKMGPDGKQLKLAGLQPGKVEEIPTSCLKDVLIARTICGTCIGSFEVTEGVSDWFISSLAAENQCASHKGEWSDLAEWPVIPVTIINLPDGTIYGLAARNEDDYQGATFTTQWTQGAIYDPITGGFVEKDLPGHDLFCAGMTMLPDGRIYAGGGGRGPSEKKVSIYDPASGEWTRERDMLDKHWYGTSLVTADDRMLMAMGKAPLSPSNWFSVIEDNFREWTPEISAPNFDFSKEWTYIPGADMTSWSQPKSRWYPQMHLMHNGKVLVSGTINEMFVMDPDNGGSLQFAGLRNKNADERESWGASTIYYEKNKLIAIGGIDGYDGDNAEGAFSLNRVIDIDMSNPDDIVTEELSPMWFNRSFQNVVPLPNGEIFVVGGTYGKSQWDTKFSVKTPEIYNPTTGKWTLMEGADHLRPRNYHSTAVLLPDARIFSGGGGLCGMTCDKNELNSQIYSPPYLFNDDGSLAGRPELLDAPTEVSLGETFKVTVSGAGAGTITRFSWIKHAAVTHSITTDLRQLTAEVNGAPTGGGWFDSDKFTYEIKTESNPNIMLRGYWFLFAVNDDGVPSIAKTIMVS